MLALVLVWKLDVQREISRSMNRSKRQGEGCTREVVVLLVLVG